MIDRRFWLLIAMGAVVYVFVAYLIQTQRAPFSFSEIFEFLAEHFRSFYFSIIGE